MHLLSRFRAANSDPLASPAFRSRLLAYLSDTQRAACTSPAPRKVYPAGRRAGKTTVTFAEFLLFSMPGETHPYICPTAGRAWDLIAPKVSEFEREFPELRGRFELNRLLHTVRAPNGAVLRCFGLSSTPDLGLLRGERYPLAWVDEAGAIAEARLREALLECIEPATLDFAHLPVWGYRICGTPSKVFGGYWHHLCEEGAPGEKPTGTPPERWRWTLRDNPRFAGRAEQLLAEVRAANGWTEASPAYLREYEARFAVDTAGGVFAGWDGTTHEPPRRGAGETVLGIAFDYLNTRTGLVVVQQTPDAAAVRGSRVVPTHDLAQVVAAAREMCAEHGAQLAIAPAKLAESLNRFGLPTKAEPEAGLTGLPRLLFVSSLLSTGRLAVAERAAELCVELANAYWNSDRSWLHPTCASVCTRALLSAASVLHALPASAASVGLTDAELHEADMRRKLARQRAARR